MRMKKLRRIWALALAVLMLTMGAPAFADAPAGYVTISFEDNGVRTSSSVSFPDPLGSIVTAKKVPYYEGENIAQVTQRLLEDEGITMTNTGSVISSFYLSSIGGFYSAVKGGNVASFGEFDAGPDSGWMITLNSWFINKGASEFPVDDGDIIKWKYTCQKGADIGCDWSSQSAKITGVAIDGAYGTMAPAFSDSVENYTLTVPSGVEAVKLEALLENYWSIVTYTSGDATYKPLAAIPVENGTVITIDSGWAEYAGNPYTDTDRVTITVVKEAADPLGGFALGDVSADGNINVSDVMLTLQYAAGNLAANTAAWKRADVNGDGGVNVTDMMLVLQVAAGKLGSFPQAG